jgi:hypothetical protein
MQKIQNLLMLALLLGFTAVACHKHDDDDSNNPVITITAPAIDASISGAVTIAGLVTDESLHEMSIKVTKDSDNSELFSATPEVHDLTSYTIAEIWTPAGISAETAVTLTVVAEDHNSNAIATTVKFKVKP